VMLVLLSAKKWARRRPERASSTQSVNPNFKKFEKNPLRAGFFISNRKNFSLNSRAFLTG